MAIDKTKFTAFTIRVTHDMAERIAGKANKNKRSMNNQIVFDLEKLYPETKRPRANR